jgi:hydroxyacylglutathione hydrolase
VLLKLPSLEDVKRLEILTTHKHWDHSHGNVEIAKAHPDLDLRVVANPEDHVPGLTESLDFALSPTTSARSLPVETQVPGVTVYAINTPCHSSGSVMFYVEWSENSSDPGPQKFQECFINNEGEAV